MAVIATRHARRARSSCSAASAQSLRLVAQALAARARRPYGGAEDATLPDAPEAQDLVALLDALVSPRHDLSLAHALRSPLFGASDDDLLALRAGRAERRELVACAGASSQRAEPGARARAHAAAGAGSAPVAALPPHDLLDRIVVEGDAARALRGRGAAEQRALALDAIDARARRRRSRSTAARYATPYSFVRALQAARASRRPRRCAPMRCSC